MLHNKYIKVTTLISLRLKWLMCLSVFLFQINEQLSAQNISEDFKRIHHTYYEGDYAYDMLYDVFDINNKPIPNFSMKTSIYRYKGNMYSKLGEIETVRNPKYSLMINNERKLMMLNYNNIKKGRSIEQSFYIDTLVKHYERTVLVKDESKERTYRVFFNKRVKQYQSAEISFNPRNYIPTKIILYLRKSSTSDSENEGKSTNKSAMIIVSINHVIFPTTSFPPNYSLKEYVSENRKGFNILSKYNKYKFIDYTTSQR